MKVRLRVESVREILARLNRNQSWLASRLKISRGYCSQLLAGSRYPSASVRRRILDALGRPDFDEVFEFVKATGNRVEAGES